MACKGSDMDDIQYGDTLEFPLDDYGRITGFQVGKAAAMLDWEAAKEDRKYAELFARLDARNNARVRRATDPERARDNLQAWRDRNREKVRAAENARRLAQRKANPVTCKCDECGAEREIPPGGRPGRFCDRRCTNRWHGKRRKRNRGIRNMNIERDILTALRMYGWLTLAGLAIKLPKAKRGSINTKLCTMRKVGQVRDDGRRKFRAYALAVTAVAER